MDVFELWILINVVFAGLAQFAYVYILERTNILFQKGKKPLFVLGLNKFHQLLASIMVSAISMISIAFPIIEANTYLTIPITISLLCILNLISSREKIYINFHDTFLRIVFPMIIGKTVSFDLQIKNIHNVIFEQGYRVNNLVINFSFNSHSKAVRSFNLPAKRGELTKFFVDRNIELFRKNPSERISYPIDKIDGD